MNVRQVNDEGNLWFMSAADSRMNEELALDLSVKLYFQGWKHSDFMQLDGYAPITRDKAKIKELWSPMVQTGFTEGMDDPRVTVIKVTPTAGSDWDTKPGNAVAAVKMMIGAALRKTLDNSVEWTLEV